ncbi:acyl-CoA dehydrogenase family protein [Roseisolibacter sp. H3M3-2]|uniref:acyl-CoA dehydrogenase family protein n=1 Tax=Roseisolibacter sp. H3M3-2 TaxID=3031323 RepID=UPI0023D987B8|nr:acyl-CoA dehydrogenase family protein [Roseisolibacter sp. H3M3-2]MDF1504795.1 acyl-CoA dehydrogenase family protein [Roseisolibacter sp. H3M3-2]
MSVAPLLDRIRGFLDARVLPLEPAFLQREFRDLLPELGALRAEVKARGLWAPYLPASLGGLGLSLVEYAEVSAVLGTSPMGHYLFNCQAPDVGNVELLHAHGSPALQARWLEPLAAGEIRSCFSMTEPDYPGSNPVWMGTRAERHGDAYVITGRKWFTSSADGAAFAIVMAVTDPDAPPHRRASQIVVPMDAPGVRLVRNVRIMGEAGSDWASHAEVHYDGVRVPVANRIGPQGEGFALAQERLGPGRIHHCMRWVGICERALDLMCRRAATRMLAPGRALGAQQQVQFWIAESRAEVDAARLYVMDTARRIDADGAPAARDAISAIKFHVAGVLQRVLDRAIQVHGALGVTDDTPLAWWYRHERGARIYDGADEVHKASLARRILKRYGLDARE